MRPDINARLLLQLDDLTDLHRGAGAGPGVGRVRHGVRAPGSNVSRLIVGLVAPHREERARETPRERDHSHLLSAPTSNRLRPRPEMRRARIEARDTRQAACTSKDCRCGCASRRADMTTTHTGLCRMSVGTVRFATSGGCDGVRLVLCTPEDASAPKL